MSYFTRKQLAVSMAGVVSSLTQEIATNGTALGDENTVKDLLGLEGHSEPTSALQDADMQIATALKSSELPELLQSHLGLTAEEAEESQAYHNGMNAASITLHAAADPVAYQNQFVNPKKGSMGGQVVRTAVPGVTSTTDVGIEAFDSFQMDKFIAQSVVTNALAAATDGFEEAFFGTVVIPGSFDGVDISVAMPKIYNSSNRSKTGNRFTQIKRSIVEAIYDHTVLETNSSKILVNGALTGGDAALLANGEVTPWKDTQSGVEVDVAALVLDKDVDLLGISQNGATFSTSEDQDETDTLHPVIGLGTLFVKITHNGSDAVVALPTKGLPGALFTPTVDGRDQELQLNFRNELIIRHDTLLTDNSTVQATLGLDGATALGGATEYALFLDVVAFGSADHATGMMRVSASAEGTVSAKKGAGFGVDLTAAEIASINSAVLADAITFEIVGYHPDAMRTVSNMRGRHLMMENASTTNYRLPVEMGSPISSVKPVSLPGGGASLDQLTMARKAVNSNSAVSTLLAAEDMLSNGRGLPSSSTAVGQLLVRETYHRVEWDAGNTSLMNEADGLQNPAASLASAITLLASRLISDSKYLTALKMFTGSMSGYEVVIGCDEHVGALLSREGDSRTLFNMNFRIAVSPDVRLKNRVYVSVRRTNTSGQADPLSFGVHATMPSLIYSANTPSGSGVVAEQQMIPRDTHAMLCPVLGRVDIKGLDDLYSQDV